MYVCTHTYFVTPSRTHLHRLIKYIRKIPYIDFSVRSMFTRRPPAWLTHGMFNPYLL